MKQQITMNRYKIFIHAYIRFRMCIRRRITYSFHTHTQTRISVRVFTICFIHSMKQTKQKIRTSTETKKDTIYARADTDSLWREKINSVATFICTQLHTYVHNCLPDT